ncbi:transmembrane protein 179-like [Eurytemora carolleeae]|uniref:transmembrane protein 179-like n=1 Tax=Eurytemora carolleeae TaxID=1294199 RepID=UPI000C792E9A|nr:transmembrane protein 179-like [Eurytemora carolleeae]|eukprot:XP_023345481.1 transmembrane protein 179-like [Eurytemora affinis]
MPSTTGTNVILYIQLAGYCIAALLSLLITIPMSMHQENFKGHCLLFSTGEWRETDGQFIVDWASQAYCNYTIFVGVVMLVISATQIYRLSKFLCKGRDSSFLTAFIDVITSLFMSGMTLTAALFITLGFNTWCGEMTRRFESCADATENDIAKADAIDPQGFYMQLFAAQFGVWLSWTTWMGLLVFSVVKLCKYHQQENIRVSMAKERKRLIKEDLITEVPRPGRDNPAQETSIKVGGNRVGTNDVDFLE